MNYKEFLYCLRDLSGVSHTAKVIEEEIERVIMAIGPKKVSAIVTDNASSMMNARKRISEKYPHIVNMRCIVHFVNLITKDILSKKFSPVYSSIIYIFTVLKLELIQPNLKFLGHNFANKIVKNCNTICRFFKTSHKAGHVLNEIAKEYKIEGGGLSTYTPTRWTSMYETTNGVVRLKRVLEKVRIIIRLLIFNY
jgi:hypothetical protein